MRNGSAPLLEVDNLRVEYRTGFLGKRMRVVDDASFTVGAGETLCIVGDSGSGKSTIGGAILGLREIAGGSIRLRGEDITHARRGRRRELSREVQAVFQDAASALDPAHTVGDAIAEPLVVGTSLSREVVHDRVVDILKRVDLPASAAALYPAEFSRSQLECITIARAVIGRPALIICDEAFSPLNPSTLAPVRGLLDELQKEAGTSYLFLARDSSTVADIADRVLELRDGRILN